jgi:hypothetical protein
MLKYEKSLRKIRRKQYENRAKAFDHLLAFDAAWLNFDLVSHDPMARCSRDLPALPVSSIAGYDFGCGSGV